MVESRSNYGNAVEHGNRYLVFWSSGRSGKSSIKEMPNTYSQLISLIYGGDFNLVRPRTVPYGHEEYNLEVLKQQFRYFGPFPAKYEEIASPETVTAILYLMHEIPQSQTTPFSRTTEREVSLKDKEFISEIMKLDWRDRPTAQELLKDRWFQDDEYPR